ncbi:hypothetical protein EYF80_005661 [Liparis tanakae]|uniref:Uncharacterized protein n=1 Tax=Liparis tanakae TaxID=230148 RepID=A0A4Z2J174_9TELE|nr:hypothetical protein EYF80_005661 [Liparis tanakae]
MAAMCFLVTDRLLLYHEAFWKKPGFIYVLQPVSSQHPAPFLSSQRRHHPHVEHTVASSERLLHRPLGLTLFIMASPPPLSGFRTTNTTTLLLISATLNAVCIKGRKLFVRKSSSVAVLERHRLEAAAESRMMDMMNAVLNHTSHSLDDEP